MKPFLVPILIHCLWALLSCLGSLHAQEATPSYVDSANWSILAPGVISLPDIRETSPSLTADGNTLVFARTQNWGDKVPYLATRANRDAPWQVQPLPFADTLYNLAISPDGQTIFMKQYDSLNQAKVSRAFRVDRTEDGWGEPIELDSLFNVNAGYFCPMADGKLYLFAPGVRGSGIYVSYPHPDGSYSPPQWLSDAVNLTSRTTFDVLMHPDEDQLIVTHVFSDEEKKAGKGPRGLYHYQKTAQGWGQGRYLRLPYGWGATATPAGQLLFVDAGDLQIIDLAVLGIDW